MGDVRWAVLFGVVLGDSIAIDHVHSTLASCSLKVSCRPAVTAASRECSLPSTLFLLPRNLRLGQRETRRSDLTLCCQYPCHRTCRILGSVLPRLQ